MDCRLGAVKLFGVVGTLWIAVGCHKSTAFPPPFKSCEDEVIRLDSSDPELRLIAAKRLEGCDAIITVKALQKHLRSEGDDTNATRISLTLAKFQGSSKFVETLINSESADLRRYGVLAMNPADALRFKSIMEDPSPDVRLAYAYYKLKDRHADLLSYMLTKEKDERLKRIFENYMNGRVKRKWNIRKRSMKEILAEEKSTYSQHSK